MFSKVQRRRVRRAFTAVALTAAIGLLAACAPPPPPYRVIPEEWNGGVQATTVDVPYGSHRMQRADLYVSPGSRGTIVFLHGGGWVAGDKSTGLPSLLLHEVTRGYDVMSINYRLAPSNPFPAAVHDAAQAVRWVRKNGAALGLSPTRIVLAGHSAGANIAALAAYGANGAFPGGALAPVDGALLLAGAYDFANTRVGVFGPNDDWLGRLESPGGWLSRPQGRTAGSPVTWLDAKDPATLAIHGSADPILSIDQSRALQQRSAAVGHSNRLQSFEVTTTAFGDGCRGHVPWCGAPVDMVDRFLDRIRGGQQ
jgi:acetyl esterase/lipase